MKPKKPKAKWTMLLFALLLVIAITTVTVSAYYIKRTDELKNSFTPAVSVNPEVDEKFENNLKENVSVEVGDTGYPVYVRAAIVVTWRDKDGNVLYKESVNAKAIPEEDPDTTPNACDYLLLLNLSAPESTTGWVKGGDGYYYYQTPVDSGKKTDILIKKCTPLGNAGENILWVEIIPQTVQAIGTTDQGEIPALMDAWNLQAWPPV